MKIVCPAKLNLYLEILGRRPDGYHDLRLLNTAVDLADLVELKRAGEGIEIKCDHPGVPLGPENLCAKAAEAFFQAYPQTRTGLAVTIHKQIPVAGGLGGGSSDAAGVLWGLGRLTGAQVSDADLRKLGATVGADVPFFLFSSPAWVLGKGEILREAESIPGWYYVLVSFDFGVSTAWAFSAWDLTKRGEKDILEILKRGAFPGPGLFQNDLEEVVLSRYPAVGAAKEAVLAAGAQGSAMSGSGPSVFGAFFDEAAAAEAAARLRHSLGVAAIITRGLRGPILRAKARE